MFLVSSVDEKKNVFSLKVAAKRFWSFRSALNNQSQKQAECYQGEFWAKIKTPAFSDSCLVNQRV